MSPSCLQNKVQSPQMALCKTTFVCQFRPIFLLSYSASCSMNLTCVKYINRLLQTLAFGWVSPTRITSKKSEEGRKVRSGYLFSWLPYRRFGCYLSTEGHCSPQNGFLYLFQLTIAEYHITPKLSVVKTTILFCLWILWVRTLNRAQHGWPVSAPQYLEPQLKRLNSSGAGII